MLITAAAKAAESGFDWKFLIGLLTVLMAIFTLWVNGRRTDRARRRELYAGGWASVQAYKEFAFAVRRRNQDEPAAERVRVSEALREVQKDLAYYEALIGNERSGPAATNYRNLVAKTREVAGEVIRDSWNEPPITEDKQMHAPHIAKRLEPLKIFEDAFQDAVRDDLDWTRDFMPRGR